jgi:signal transduction histidine kinase
LYLANKRGGSEFSEADLVTAESIASYASSAIQIAQQYKSEVLGHAWIKGVIDQMPEAVIIFNETAQIILQNQVAISMVANGNCGLDPFGNPFLYDLRRPSGEPLAPEDRPSIRALKNGITVTGIELLLHAKGDRRIPVLVSATPIFDSDSRIRGAIVVFQDISAIKELERLREEWISIVAHDLRQPIQIISGAVEMITTQKGSLPAETFKLIDIVASNTSALNRMIHDLLDASRLEARRLSIDKKPTDLANIVEMVGETFQRTCLEHSLRVRIALRPCPVLVDAQRIEQVLNNLLSNAARYSDKNSEIELELQNQEHEVLISVANQGIGLTAGQIQGLFQRFNRTSTPARDTSGIGLGLYIAKGLVDAHGGNLSVHSIPGDKTIFTISLPKETIVG